MFFFTRKKPNETSERRNEILDLNRKLEEFDIRFANLADKSSGVETQTLLDIGKSVAQNEELLDTLHKERKLPVQKLLMKHADIPRKILDDHHQFIVAMALIFSGPYPCLRKYVGRAFP